MRLKIGNLLAFVCLVGSLCIFIQFRPQIIQAVNCIGTISPGHPFEEQTTGSIVVGLILLGLLSCIKLLTSEEKK